MKPDEMLPQLPGPSVAVSTGARVNPMSVHACIDQTAGIWAVSYRAEQRGSSVCNRPYKYDMRSSLAKYVATVNVCAMYAAQTCVLSDGTRRFALPTLRARVVL
jgi:hypothetical protein